MARIGLVSLWAQKLLRPNGENLTAFRHHEPQGGMAILAGNLIVSGHEVQFINLKAGGREMPYGEVVYCGEMLTKVMVGTPIEKIDTDGFDIVGITVQYLQDQELAGWLIGEMKRRGHRVVVGGSQAFCDPTTYLKAGADVVVLDKSGASNQAAIQVGLDKTPSGSFWLVTRSGKIGHSKPSPLHPEDWPLPSVEIARDCLGTQYWEGPLSSELLPVGLVLPDQGCDRNCGFCQTSRYGFHYSAMSPRRALEWLKLQRDAGAHSVAIASDQFLGRVLTVPGRSEVLEIVAGARELRLPVLWGNGLELAKATIGKGLPDSITDPDEELVRALWGWDPIQEVGCAQAYIPAERPSEGPSAYRKLLPWDAHRGMMRAIVAAGVPDITYGLIIGLPRDSHELLRLLQTRIGDLVQELKKINPHLRFRVCPYAIRPIPGTPDARELAEAGLLEYTNPAIAGGFWTPCARTGHLSVQEISAWQRRFVEIGDPEPDWQGLTALTGSSDP